MAAVRYARRALADLERLTDFLRATAPAAAGETTVLIVEAVDILRHHPRIGRPGYAAPAPSPRDPSPARRSAGFRELVISRGRTGYVALYHHDEVRDVVTILAIRHQREAGFD